MKVDIHMVGIKRVRVRGQSVELLQKENAVLREKNARLLVQPQDAVPRMNIQSGGIQKVRIHNHHLVDILKNENAALRKENGRLHAQLDELNNPTLLPE